MLKGQKNPNAKRKCRSCGKWMRWGGAQLQDGTVSVTKTVERAQPPMDERCLECVTEGGRQLTLLEDPKRNLQILLY